MIYDNVVQDRLLLISTYKTTCQLHIWRATKTYVVKTHMNSLLQRLQVGPRDAECWGLTMAAGWRAVSWRQSPRRQFLDRRTGRHNDIGNIGTLSYYQRSH